MAQYILHRIRESLQTVADVEDIPVDLAALFEGNKLDSEDCSLDTNLEFKIMKCISQDLDGAQKLYFEINRDKQDIFLLNSNGEDSDTQFSQVSQRRNSILISFRLSGSRIGNIRVLKFPCDMKAETRQYTFNLFLGLVEGFEFGDVLPAATESESSTETSLEFTDCEIPPRFIGQLQASLYSFNKQIDRSISQSRGEGFLKVPRNVLSILKKQKVSEEGYLSLEKLVGIWKCEIDRIIDFECSKENDLSNCPLEELEFWQGRADRLVVLEEILSNSIIERIFNILETRESGYLANLLTSLDKAMRLHLEAQDNTKFLSTLNVSLGKLGDSHQVLEQKGQTLQKIFSILTVVWINSRFYNTDDRMLPFLLKIQHSLLATAGKIVQLSEFRELNTATIVERFGEVSELSHNFRVYYLEARKSIEESGSKSRWDFNRAFLLEKTDILHEICQEFKIVFMKLEDFSCCLRYLAECLDSDDEGLEMCSVQLDQVVQEIEKCNISITDTSKKHELLEVISSSDLKLVEIESQIANLITISFSSLTSSQEALKLSRNLQYLNRYEKIKSRINDQLSKLLEYFHTDIQKLNQTLLNFELKNGLCSKLNTKFGRIAMLKSLKKKTMSLLENIRPFEESLVHLSNWTDTLLFYISLLKDINKSVSEEERHISFKLENSISEVRILRFKCLSSSLEKKENVMNNGKILETREFMCEKLYYVMKNIRKSLVLQDETGYDEIIDVKYLLATRKQVALIPRILVARCTEHRMKRIEYNRIINKVYSLAEHLSQAEVNILLSLIGKLVAELELISKDISWSSQFASQNMKRVEDLCDKISSSLIDVRSFFRININCERKVLLSSCLLKRCKDISSIKLENLLPLFHGSLDIFKNELCETLDQDKRYLNSCLNKLISNQNVSMSEINELMLPYVGKRCYDFFIRIALDVIIQFALFFGFHQSSKIGSSLTITLSTKMEDNRVVLTYDINVIIEYLTKVVECIIGKIVEVQNEFRSLATAFKQDSAPANFLFGMSPDSNDSVNTLKKSLIKNFTSEVENALIVLKKFNKKLSKYFGTSNIFSNAIREGSVCPQQFYESKLRLQELQECKANQEAGTLVVNLTDVLRELELEHKVLSNRYFEVRLSRIQQDLHSLSVRITEYSNICQLSTDSFKNVERVLKSCTTLKQTRWEIEESILHMSFALKEIGALGNDMLVVLNDLKERFNAVVTSLLSKGLRVQDKSDEIINLILKENEDLMTSSEKLKQSYLTIGPKSIRSKKVCLESELETYEMFCKEVHKLKLLQNEMIHKKRMFALDISGNQHISFMEKELDSVEPVFSHYIKVKKFEENISSMLWSQFDVESLRRGAADLIKVAQKMDAKLKSLTIFDSLLHYMQDLNNSFSLLFLLKADCLRSRHWMQIQDVTNVYFEFTPEFSIGKLLSMSLGQFETDINDIVYEATQEVKLGTQLDELFVFWESNALSFAPIMVDGKPKAHMLKDCDAVLQDLEDHLLNLQSIAGSKFAVNFQDSVHKLEIILNGIYDTVSIWLKIQSKWLYLENIYIGAEDIRIQLPRESEEFDRIDLKYRSIVDNARNAKNACIACQNPQGLYLVETLNQIGEDLDKAQKSLSDYLHSKRNVFPRFFFISDDELLSILGSSSPEAIQEHMLKLYDNTKSLLFSKNLDKITGVSSSEGEMYLYSEPIGIHGAIETWMKLNDSHLRKNIRMSCKQGIYDYVELPRLEWVEQAIGMVGVLGSQVWWTAEVEEVFRLALQENDRSGMKNLLGKLDNQLDELVAHVRKDISSSMRKKVNTLLIIEVHARDIVDGFVRDSILDHRCFEWESQLRFYWCQLSNHMNDDRPYDFLYDGVNVQQCTGCFEFGYEYMGLNGRLVITSLTDRCYMTITTGLTFFLGTAPSGPAGTGKTETTKDLAKGLGIPCFVINCGEGLDFKAMGSIFSGLAQVGAWGCFDEFNRINIEVLSVVAAQIEAIQEALKLGESSCDIRMGNPIMLNPKIGIFITMNPGYAGRTELPDNLKALFRPVTMIVPDLLQICEIMLFSEGFLEAKNLAKKMTSLYKLAKGQLSKQFHYDFGLRALKSVLVMAGALKREYSELPEEVVLMRALRDSNMPKFVYEDVPLFKGLISDLFPSVSCPRVTFEKLKLSIENLLISNMKSKKNSLSFRLQVDKIIQIYETMLTRHTCMVVGPTGGGKSVALETLAEAQEVAFGNKVLFNIINPKAQDLNELYGELDPVTRDWTDGVLSCLFRNMNEPLTKNSMNIQKWLIFDGDVDALWIENMNSVMDDNKLLTLPNSERIRLQSHCKIIMETYDLQYASPATISRCGMIYVDPKELGFECYFERWLSRRKEGLTRYTSFYKEWYERLVKQNKQGEHDNPFEILASQNEWLTNMFREIFCPLLELVFTAKLDTLVKLTRIGVVIHLCTLLECLLALSSNFDAPSDMWSDSDCRKLERQTSSRRFNELYEFNLSEEVVINVFVYATIWAVGGYLDRKGRNLIETELKELTSYSIPENCYTCFFDHEKMLWVEWSSQVIQPKLNTAFDFHQIFVPTSVTMSTQRIFELYYMMSSSTICVGGAGSSKTVLINNFIQEKLYRKDQNSITMNFSSRTKSGKVQAEIEDNLDKRTKNIYGPKQNKKLIIYVDDINMPRMDTYGTQQPIALLLFLLSHKSLYGRGKDLSLKIIQDVTFMAAFNNNVGNILDTRFVSCFKTVCVSAGDEENLYYIFSTILNLCFSSKFTCDYTKIIDLFCNKTLGIYKCILESYAATPNKFFYIYTLKDLSRVFEGFCQFNSALLQLSKDDNELLHRFIYHENSRVFADRFNSNEDKQLFDSFISSDILPGVEKASIFACLKSSSQTDTYQEYTDNNDVRVYFEKVLQDYNIENNEMSLVLFEDCIGHVAKLNRILSFQRGHCLFIGVGGTGKQSLTRLVAHAYKYQVFEISLARNYGEAEFIEDLKAMFNIAFLKSVVFIIKDSDIAEEGFLEYVNVILTTGRLPSLYLPEEKDAAINKVRKVIKEQNIALEETKENLWNYFWDRIQENLHLILTMSPSGQVLSRRCRSFPGLLSGCSVNFFFPWSSGALHSVSEFFLKDVKLQESIKLQIYSQVVSIHESILSANLRFQAELQRENFVTPKHYLDFIKSYGDILKEHRDSNKKTVTKLEGGLQKLESAAIAVSKMKKELAEKTIIVEAKTDDCTKMIADIDVKQKVASEKSKTAQEKKIRILEKKETIRVEKARADQRLTEALPLLEAAASAIDNLDKNDITEIKGFSNPPLPVMQVCSCTLILKPIKGISDEVNWNNCKTMLANSKFLDSLKNYDKDKISEKQIKKIRVYYKDSNFNQDVMGKVSKAGSGLFCWVNALVKYYEVAKNIKPLREKVRNLEIERAKGEEDYAQTMSLLSELEAELSILNTNFNSTNLELTELKMEAQLMAKRLDAANRLISGLSSERVRWKDESEKLNNMRKFLPGECLVSAGFLNYLGVFTSEYRTSIISSWLTNLENFKIPISDGFSCEKFLITDAEIQELSSDGLPIDNLSVQNAIITLKTSRFPLCIDPQEQAVHWIKNKEKKNNLVIKLFSEGDFLKHLELAVQFGNSFLFPEVSEVLDPVINPILEKKVFNENGNLKIKIGEKIIDWDLNFQLFLTTKLSNPKYTPEVLSRVMLINYSLTGAGLSDQLLIKVVSHEQEDLERQFVSVVDEVSRGVKELAVLETNLLIALANSEGNILDDDNLIQTLETTKLKSIEISQQILNANKTKAEIQQARQEYKEVANRGSVLFFAMMSMSSINSMYEVSLYLFQIVFIKALSTAPPGDMLEDRIRSLVEEITKQVYYYMCTGLFEKHKLLFTFQMALLILRQRGILNQALIDFLLKGVASQDDINADSIPCSWISPLVWKEINFLSTLESSFSTIVQNISANQDLWTRWYFSSQPEVTPLPGYDKSEPMTKLLICRVLRPDRGYLASRMFIANLSFLGDQFVQPPTLNYLAVFNQSDEKMPLIFINSPGADPGSDIKKLHISLGFDPDTLRSVSLGQGQEPIAMALLEDGIQNGFWILLQNCHLLLKWLGELEARLASLATETVHSDFRLWLTTDPCPSFPLGILQRSIKVVLEPPDGLRLNMKSTYSKFNEDHFTLCSHERFDSLIFSLSFLHAILQERRKYGKIGFNVCYDFNFSDFQVSFQLLQLYLEKAFQGKNDDVPWSSLKYLIGDAMYGGRVSDNFDRRILGTYMDEYFGDFLYDEVNKFHFSRSGFDYEMPNKRGFKQHVAHIGRIPLSSSPEVFGLHMNADINHLESATKQLFYDLLLLQPRNAGLGSSEEENLVYKTATKLLEQLPALYNVSTIRLQYGDVLTPTQVVLFQELDRFNILIGRLRVTCADLVRALRGEIGLNEELEEISLALNIRRVPDSWKQLAPKTQKNLFSWIDHFDKRCEQYNAWIACENVEEIWLGGLHVPESFLAALTQTACRANSWPLDGATIFTKVFDAETDSKYTNTCFIRGLYLEGAAWDTGNNCLKNQEWKELVCEMPNFIAIPIQKHRLNLAGYILTPVYVTQERRNAMGVGLVFEAYLATAKHSSFWILQGVALFLNIDS